MKRLTITGLAALLLMVVGCQSQTKQYSLRGQVLAKDQAAGQLTVMHDDIPGFMPAMTMPYKVKDPAAMQDVQPGDTIAADLISVNGAKDYWLQSVRIVDQSRRQTAKPAVKHALKVGEAVPDIPMINQDGKQIHLGDFKGKSVLITFIYTRCPMPAFCTRRLIRPSEAPPLGTIRSLAYFLPVIEEVLASHVSPEYFEYLRYKLARTTPPR